MAWFEWVGSWGESVGFGLAMVLTLFAVECLLMARKSYQRTRTFLDEGALLGAEFGVFSAPSARIPSEPAVPRNCYLLAVVGAASLIAALGFLVLAFA